MLKKFLNKQQEQDGAGEGEGEGLAEGEGEGMAVEPDAEGANDGLKGDELDNS